MEGGAGNGSGDYPQSTGHHQPSKSSNMQSQPPLQSCLYRPPSRHQHAQPSSAAFGPNPYQTSEEAFVNLSSALLQKHAAYNYPPSYILYNHLSDVERRNYAQAYHSYLNREEVTTYAEVGERPIVQTLRGVRKVFGPSLNGVGGDGGGGGGKSAAPTNDNHASTLHLTNEQNYGPEQQQQQQQHRHQQQAPYSGSAHSSTHYQHDVRDDVDTGSDHRSVHTSASRRSYYQPPTNKGRLPEQQQQGAQHHQQVYFEHDYQQQQQQQRHGDGGGGQQRGGRWAVPAASRKADATGPSTTGQYVNMDRQYDHAKPSYGPGGSVKKETELTTRSRSIPGKRVGNVNSGDTMDLRQTMSLEESKAIRTQSQARQQLMEEMNHAQELLNRATNLKDRVLYQSHMERLRKELQDLTDANGTGTCSRRASLSSQYQPPISPSASLDDCASITSAGKKALGQYVNVVAPGNLPENYQFEATMGKDTFTATVPTGGVTKGQMFTSRVGSIGDGRLKSSIAAEDNDVATVVFEDDDDDVATIATYEKPLRKAYSKMDIPRGRWRDGLMDGLFEGPLHPLFWHSWFCPQIALAQIMSRLRIVGPHKAKGFLLKSKLDLTMTVLLTILFYFVNLMVAYVLFGRSYVLGKAPSTTLLLSFGIPVLLVDAMVVCLFYFLLIKTRKIVRENYGIPEGKQCPGNEDALVSIFCTSCTVSQMGRHTADYTTYRGHCCTQTGLPDHVACDV